MKYKEVYDIAMPIAKRKEEKFNIWVTIAVRPLSVWLTLLFVETKVHPITITKWSILASVCGSIVISIATDLKFRLLGWLLFFIWAVLDGVDGNLARCQKKCSTMGDLWDTMGGYAAMVLIYLSASIVAYYDQNALDFCDKALLLVAGGITAVASIFPRLIMHKKKSSNINSTAVKAISDKQRFNFSKIFAMNIVSPSGFMQIILLSTILTHTLNFFICFYLIINLGIMVISLKQLLSND